jgi:hypothetical protein
MVCGWGYPPQLKEGGHHDTPSIPSPDSCFPRKSRRRNITGRNRLTGVPMRPPPHKVTPLHPYLFPKGGGVPFRQTPEGVSTQTPLLHPDRQCIAWSYRRRGVFPCSRKKGGGSGTPTTSHPSEMRPPPPYGTPP